MALSRKTVKCSPRVGNEILPQVEEFKYLGVLFTSEGQMEREIDGGDRCSVCSVAGSAPTCRCEEEAEPEGEALYLLVNLRSHPHLWSRFVGSDRKNEIANTSGRKWALP